MISWIGNLKSIPRDVLLIDRDGVLNRDHPDYVKNWQEFQFYPDALSALQWLCRHHIGVIVISNQSALHRGYMDWDSFWQLHHSMIHEIRRVGGDLLAAYYCPHRPDEHCTCRKPSPEMLLHAARTFGLTLASTTMIGDRETDLLAARNAGCRPVWLDRTGQDAHTRHSPGRDWDPAQARFTSLLEAVQILY